MTSESDASDRSTRPFLRWAGGKRWLARAIPGIVPNDIQSYHEPFLGSGAVFFALAPSRPHLADSNDSLIGTFQTVRDRPGDLIATLRRFRYNKRAYYRVRSSSPSGHAQRAARFIFLNRTCWNGLYRVNSRGQFNVPYGRRVRKIDRGEDALLNASKALQGAEIECRDFEDSIDRVRSGGFIFADPPYTVAHENNGFVLYNETIFSWADQERLAAALVRASERGARFVLTNADHRSIRVLYRRFRFHQTLERSSIIAADTVNRRTVSELLISNYHLPRIEN